MRLTDLLALSHVPRWAIVPHLKPQSVADHSFRVAVIYLELCDRCKIPASLAGLTRALFHDGAEARSGDIPGPFKRSLNGDLAGAEKKATPWLEDGSSLSPDDRWALKMADIIEAYTFISQQGQGPHAARTTGLVWESLKEHARMRYPEIRVLVQDILDEADRT
jgi:hypothetical protein